MVCNQCGAPLEGSMKFCQYCGTEINQEKKQGKKINSIKVKNIINRNKNIDVISDTICDDFEDRINKNDIVANKNKSITILLMATLGFFGAHKFYFGDIKSGVIYVVNGVISIISLLMVLLILGFYPKWFIPIWRMFPKLFFKMAVYLEQHLGWFTLVILIAIGGIMVVGSVILRDLFNYCFMDKVQWCNTVGYIEKK